MSRLVGRIGLSLVLLLVSTARADDPCPSGATVLLKEGSDNGISWKSRAVQVRSGDADWCYDRKVVLTDPTRQYVNWPEAGISKQTVVNEWTVKHCCYPGPRPKDAELEHGYESHKVSTQVYEGDGEPKSHSTSTSVTGFLYLGGKTVYVDLTFRSSYTYHADVGFQYEYEVINKGDDLSFLGKSGKCPSVQLRFCKPFNDEFKMAERSSHTFSIPSKDMPKLIKARLPILSGDGDNEIISIPATAYVPTPKPPQLK